MPGVGPYTARAILAFAYNEPVLSIDTNLQKIFARYYSGSRFTKLTKQEIVEIEADFAASGISGREMNAALMDFASLVSVNNISGVNWDDYPLTECIFGKTRGVLETEKSKVRTIFPTKDAQIVVILHENHRKYYSSKRGSYSPFLLPATEGDIRHAVQEYFRENYGLEVSVRPVHTRYFRDDMPFVECRAQVQSGKVIFEEYTKENLIIPSAKV